MTTATYIVKSGDWLAKIAEDHGSTVSEIWNHPENAEHRAKRGSPDVLYPGDVLRIPVAAGGAEPPLLQKRSPGSEPPSEAPWPYPPYDGPFTTKPTWECPGGTCECHPVPEDEPRDEHVIVFYDPVGKRMPGARCCVYENGRKLTPDPTSADGAGELRVEIRASTSTLRVEWAPPDMPPHQFLPYHKTYNVKMSDDRGVALDRRLANLGFSRGKRREDNVRDYQRAYTRPPTGDAEEIRLEVLERHDHGAVEVFHPQEPSDHPVRSDPQSRALLGSPQSSASRRQLVPDGQSGGGGGAGPTTNTGQNAQGSAVPDATNMLLYVALSPDFPDLDPSKIKLTVRPVNVPTMTEDQRKKPIVPDVAGVPGLQKPPHLIYGFKDLPLGTYDVFAYMPKVDRRVGTGTTWALGYTRVELKMGLLTLGYAGMERQRPVLTVDDPALDFEIPEMQRRRKVLATIFKLFPASHSPKTDLAEIKGKHPPYGQPEYQRMLIGTNSEDTCTAVNGGVIQNAGGHGIGAGIKDAAYFIPYTDGLCPSVGDSVYYGTDKKFYHIGIIVESSADDGATWISADGGQPDRTSEFKKLQSGKWARSWHKPDYEGKSFQSMWLLPRTFRKDGANGGAGHGWAYPVPEEGGFYPILGWSDITHPDAPFPNPKYTALYSEDAYRKCKDLIRTVRAGIITDMDACRSLMTPAPKTGP
ncbi:MAG: LysM peptidoglycan-binding domain-containing protein [Myxococcales bacterium]|nr:LysM peptidoglycan-binding domain-containing protein [Myxococcales bacterium]